MHSYSIRLWGYLRSNKLFSKFPTFLNQNIHAHTIKSFSSPKVRTLTTSPSPENDYDSMLEEISKGDKEVEHKLKVILLEVELLRQEGELVPETHEMETRHYVELLKLPSRSGRKRYLEYAFKVCKKQENRLKKKQLKAVEYQKFKEQQVKKELTFEEFVQTYDLQHNNIFLRFRDKTMNNMYNNRLVQAMQFGQKLIIDCGYDKKMTSRENSNCAKQLMLLFGENRAHDSPFDLHFCNFDKTSMLAQCLGKRIDTMYDPEFPLNIHEESYKEIFPKEKLIYLTPHCKEEMKEYDHDALYIVGAIVDKMNQEPLSMAKAKQERIQMMKLPLDHYLVWSGGSGKSLTLNQVVSILLDLKEKGDWKYALRHVPTRKLVKFDDKVEDITRSLLKKKTKWSPHLNIDQLSFNRSTKKDNRNHDKKYASVSSMLFKK